MKSLAVATLAIVLIFSSANRLLGNTNYVYSDSSDELEPLYNLTPGSTLRLRDQQTIPPHTGCGFFSPKGSEELPKNPNPNFAHRSFRTPVIAIVDRSPSNLPLTFEAGTKLTVTKVELVGDFTDPTRVLGNCVEYLDSDSKKVDDIGILVHLETERGRQMQLYVAWHYKKLSKEKLRAIKITCALHPQDSLCSAIQDLNTISMTPVVGEITHVFDIDILRKH